MNPGLYQNAVIEEHGTDRTGSGLAYVWIGVRIGDEQGTCRVFLQGGDEKKSATAIRMARQALRLCGFDPDVREINDLSFDQTLLRGNVVPVRVKETPKPGGGFYENWDIDLPRGLSKTECSSMTSALRAAKAKDEAPLVEKAPTMNVPSDPEERRILREKLDAEQKALGLDCPF